VDDGLHDKTVEKLLAALQGYAPAEDVAWAAEQAWEKLIGENPVRGEDDHKTSAGQGS
jgi:hypothetical protein